MAERNESEINKAFLLRVIEDQARIISQVEEQLEALETQQEIFVSERRMALNKKRAAEAMIGEYFGDIPSVDDERQTSLPIQSFDNDLSIPELCMKLIYEGGNKLIWHTDLRKMISNGGREIHDYSVNTAVRRGKSLFRTQKRKGRSRSRLSEEGIEKARELVERLEAQAECESD